MRLDRNKFDVCLGRKGLTVPELAKVAGVSVDTIRRMRSADSTHNAQPRTMGKVASALNVDIVEIVAL